MEIVRVTVGALFQFVSPAWSALTTQEPKATKDRLFPLRLQPEEVLLKENPTVKPEVAEAESVMGAAPTTVEAATVNEMLCDAEATVKV